VALAYEAMDTLVTLDGEVLERAAGVVELLDPSV